MDLKEFQTKIDEVEDELNEGWTVCCSVETCFNYLPGRKVKDDLIKYIKPWYKLRNTNWYGPTCKKNIPKRIKALRKFEKIVIEKKIYKEY